MDGVLPIVFLGVILKIPVFFGIWLIWWAVKEEPELEDLPGDAGDYSFRRFRRNPTKPRGPRKRGPHGGAAQAQYDCPPGGRKRTPVVQPRLAPGMAAHERRERTPAGS
jgi:hypothetical protein